MDKIIYLCELFISYIQFISYDSKKGMNKIYMPDIVVKKIDWYIWKGGMNEINMEYRKTIKYDDTKQQIYVMIGRHIIYMNDRRIVGIIKIREKDGYIKKSCNR